MRDISTRAVLGRRLDVRPPTACSCATSMFGGTQPVIDPNLLPIWIPQLVARHAESGVYVCKRMAGFMRAYGAATEVYVREITKLVDAERSRKLRYGTDGAGAMLSITLFDLVEAEIGRLNDFVVLSKEACVDPMFAALKEFGHYSSQINADSEKLGQRMVKLNNGVDGERKECIKLWQNLLYAHNESAVAQKELQSCDPQKTKQAKLAKLQARWNETIRKEKEKRMVMGSGFSRFESRLRAANLEKQEMIEVDIPTMLTQLEKFETGRIKSVSKKVEQFISLIRGKAAALPLPLDKEKLIESYAHADGANRAAKLFIDRKISDSGFATEGETFPWGLPCSSATALEGEWKESSNGLILVSEREEEQKEDVLESGRGYLLLMAKNRRFAKRFFVLQDNFLCYYPSHDKVSPEHCAGAVNVVGATLARFQKEDFNKEYCFTVTPTQQIQDSVRVKMGWRKPADDPPSSSSSLGTSSVSATMSVARAQSTMNLNNNGANNNNSSAARQLHDPDEDEDEDPVEEEVANDAPITGGSFDTGPFVLVGPTSDIRDEWLLILENKIAQNRPKDEESLPFNPSLVLSSVDPTLRSNLETILDLVQHHPGEIVQMSDHVKLADFDQFARSLVNVESLFSDRSFNLVRKMAEKEVKETVTQEVLFRVDSIPSKMLTHFCRINGQGYLRTLLFRCVEKYVLEPSRKGISFELDPERIQLGLTDNERKLLKAWLVEEIGSEEFANITSTVTVTNPSEPHNPHSPHSPHRTIISDPSGGGGGGGSVGASGVGSSGASASASASGSGSVDRSGTGGSVDGSASGDGNASEGGNGSEAAGGGGGGGGGGESGARGGLELPAVEVRTTSSSQWGGGLEVRPRAGSRREQLPAALANKDQDNDGNNNNNNNNNNTSNVNSNSNSNTNNSNNSAAGPGESADQQSEADGLNSIQKINVIKAQIRTNRKHLETAISKIIQRICGSIGYCPRIIRSIFCHVQTTVKNKFPDTNWSVVGAILFLRFICPAISTGSLWNAEGGKNSGISPLGRRNLIMVTKVLQNLANGATFGSKERYMCTLNRLVLREAETVRGFFTELQGSTSSSTASTFSPSSPSSLPSSTSTLSLSNSVDCYSCTIDSPAFIFQAANSIANDIDFLASVVAQVRSGELQLRWMSRDSNNATNITSSALPSLTTSSSATLITSSPYSSSFTSSPQSAILSSLGESTSALVGTPKTQLPPSARSMGISGPSSGGGGGGTLTSGLGSTLTKFMTNITKRT